MSTNFIPAKRPGFDLDFGVRMLQAALAVQAALGLDWYDMLNVVGAPAGAVA